MSVRPGSGGGWPARTAVEHETCYDLADEAEAYLDGRIAERLEASGVAVPVWAWTNLLAHGGERDLRMEATHEARWWVHPGERWREARSYLATLVVRLGTILGPIEDLQRQVLLPLEAEITTLQDACAWQPGDLARHVEAALLAYRRSRVRAEASRCHRPAPGAPLGPPSRAGARPAALPDLPPRRPRVGTGSGSAEAI